MPPAAWDALQTYLDGHAEGWLFQTATGGQLDEPAVWRLLQALARRAGLPLRGPHGIKGDAVTHALAIPTPAPTRSSAGPNTTTPAPPCATTGARNSSTTPPEYGLAASLADALDHGAG